MIDGGVIRSLCSSSVSNASCIPEWFPNVLTYVSAKTLSDSGEHEPEASTKESSSLEPFSLMRNPLLTTTNSSNAEKIRLSYDLSIHRNGLSVSDIGLAPLSQQLSYRHFQRLGQLRQGAEQRSRMLISRV
jgi:hypothetical protein